MRKGCLPLFLGLFLLLMWLDAEDLQDPGIDVEQYDGEEWTEDDRGPRRPMPRSAERYIIQDQGPMRDSQGTAFSVDTDGVWLTAEHVTNGCDRIGILKNGRVILATRVLESRESDASIIRDGPASNASFALTTTRPRSGDRGYHMGYPGGQPVIVQSRFIGAAQAQRGLSSRRFEPIYAWAEIARIPRNNNPLGGISGGPTFNRNGQVVGINSASTDRRGRVLTTDPNAVKRLIDASGDVDEVGRAGAIGNANDAAAYFQQFIRRGLITQVYCDVY